MKQKSMKLLAVLLAAVIAVSMLSVSAFAADADEAAVALETETAQIAEPAETPTDAPVVEVTEAPTEEPTEAPTEAPTEEPTEPTVGRVTNLSRDSYESNLCLLNWDPVEGADGYYVYYLNADMHKNFSRFADVKTNSCTVTPLRQACQYHFMVSAYVKYNGKIIEGEKTLKKTATQPAKVTGLTKWRSSSVLEMEWDRNTSATGYRIYRTESGGKEVLYKTIKGNANTSFSDTSVRQGRTYKYRVKSYRDLYNTSYSSDAATMTFIAGLCGPDYSITSRVGRVNLSWRANPYATHYEVYQSTTSSNSGFVKVFTTPRLYYNTSKLTVGKTYYFRVKPIYKSGSTVIEGTSNKKSATVTDRAYGSYVGGTYIEVSIAQQHMWAYKNGKQIASTDVVTGTLGVNDTPTGYYSINYKQRDTVLYGADYASPVEYWMPFYGGYGIHDSSWRSTYGNPIYKTSGSHGCVNTPISAMRTIYNNISSGTPVIVY